MRLVRSFIAAVPLLVSASSALAGVQTGALAGVLAGQENPFPIYKPFTHWLLTCDNTGACLAEGSASEKEGDALPTTLKITREAGPSGKLALTLEGAAASPGKVTLNGAPLGIAKESWSLSDTGYTLEDPIAVKAFVGRLSQGTTLSVTKDRTISLSGLKEALGAMDDAQGRTGTDTALIQPGQISDDHVPAPRPLPFVAPITPAPSLSREREKAITHAVRTAQLKALKAHQCDTEQHTDGAYALNDRKALVILFCSVGEYQGNALLFTTSLKDPTTSEPLNLPYPKINGTQEEGDGNMLIDPDYDEKSASLSFTAKGNAGCGENGTWRFDGRNFVMTAYRYRAHFCKNVLPGDWPTLIRTAGN